MGQQFENACLLSELMKATRQCAKNVRWKASVVAYEDKALLKNYVLAKEIRKGSYEISSYIQFHVHEPKERLIHAARIRDRVWQRSMRNNGVYDDMTRGLLYENAACQVGKGTDFSVENLKKQLRRYYRRYNTNKGWAAHLDIRRYFPSTPHIVAKETLRQRIRDPDLLRHTEAIVDSFKDARTAEAIAQDPVRRGIYLGSEMSQLIQLGNLDRLDHYMKERMHVRYYDRYMDDFILVDNSKDHLMECVEYIETALHGMGLALNKKSSVFPLESGIKYLKRRFILTKTGKVIVLADRKEVAKERKKLRKLKGLLDKGRLTIADVQAHYEAWTANKKKANTRGLRKQMNRYYYGLFGEKPTVTL